MHGAAQGTDHTGGHACLEAERISDGNRHLAHTQFFRIRQAHIRKLGPINPDNREISVRVIANQLCPVLAPVWQINHQF